MLKDDVGVLSSYSKIKVELFWETIYFPKVITATDTLALMHSKI